GLLVILTYLLLIFCRWHLLSAIRLWFFVADLGVRLTPFFVSGYPSHIKFGIRVRFTIHRRCRVSVRVHLRVVSALYAHTYWYRVPSSLHLSGSHVEETNMEPSLVDAIRSLIQWFKQHMDQFKNKLVVNVCTI